MAISCSDCASRRSCCSPALCKYMLQCHVLLRETGSDVCVCVFARAAGSRLLSADGDGQIKCWSMSDHLVNSWESVLSSSLDGDPIIALSWLHNGVKLALHVEMVIAAHTCAHTCWLVAVIALCLKTH